MSFIRNSLFVLSRGGGIWNRLLSVIMVVIILMTLGMLYYMLAVPSKLARFTEFYLLGVSGQAEDYPEVLAVGEEGKVLVGIINRERETVTYRVKIAMDGVMNGEAGPVTLDHGEKWEEVVGFIPSRQGDEQKVEFLLYRQGQSEAYRRLRLWVDVR